MLRVRVFVGDNYVFWYWCDFIPRNGDRVERIGRDERGKATKEAYRVKDVTHLVEVHSVANYERADVVHLHCESIPEAGHGD